MELLPAHLRNATLLTLCPSKDEWSQIVCETGTLRDGDRSSLTVLHEPQSPSEPSKVDITVDGRSLAIPEPLVEAFKRMRYLETARHIFLRHSTPFGITLPDQECQGVESKAEYHAFWSSPLGASSRKSYMKAFHVVLSKDWEKLSSSNVDDCSITALALLPSGSQTNDIEIKCITVPVDDPPPYTLLTPLPKTKIEIKSSIIKDGSPHAISRDDLDAFRLLRVQNSTRFIISGSYQRNATEIARMQFELKRTPTDFAFWRHPESCGWTEPSPNSMDHFIITPNRYIDTPKYYTTLDYSLELKEIRVLVLPPSGETIGNILRCTFRIISLADPSKPSYELFHVAGPAKPRNGRSEIYKFDVEINGHISVVSDGMRTGLLDLQHQTGERLVYNSEVCYNCCDATEVEHFTRLHESILKGATVGNTLLYDYLSSMTPLLNHNSKFKHPEVNRNVQEIRLLEFLPSAAEDKIECRLIVQNLDDAPVFKALSYTWGSTRAMAMQRVVFGADDRKENWPNATNSSKKTVQPRGLDEEDHIERMIINNQRFLGTKHLGAALRCLRGKGDCQYFWVDAVCIDQADGSDRSSQVQMMGRIYSSAQQVIAYLGESDEEVVSLDLVNRIGSPEFDWEEFDTWAQYASEFQIVDSTLFERDLNYSSVLAGIKDPDFSRKLQQFFSDAWWDRLWVYQEATLPLSLVIHRGRSRVVFEDLVRAICGLAITVETGMLKSNPLGTNSDIVYACSKVMPVRVERRRRHIPDIENYFAPLPNPFLSYLQSLGARSCSDPRDVVYAAMGLTDAYPKKIVPDYSLSIEEIWTQAAREVMKKDQEFAILSLCTGVMDTASDWAEYWLGIKDNALRKKSQPTPSWVPHWGQHRNGMGAKRLQHDWLSVPEFRACGANATAGAKFSKDGSILFAKGVLVDVVSQVMPGYDHPVVPDREPLPSGKKRKAKATNLHRKTWLETFQRWEHAILSISPKDAVYVAGGTKVDAPMHALHAPFHLNTLTLLEGDIDTKGALPELYQKQAEIPNEKASRPSEFASRLWEREAKSDRSLLTLSSGYELITTESGYFGIVTPPVSPPSGNFAGVQVGDLLVVLCGGSVPLVLRQVGSRDRYLLVGDSYMHGLMYGAAMEGVKAEDMRKFPII